MLPAAFFVNYAGLLFVCSAYEGRMCRVVLGWSRMVSVCRKMYIIFIVLWRFVWDRLFISMVMFIAAIAYAGYLTDVALFVDDKLKNIPWEARGQIYSSLITSLSVLVGVFVTYMSWRRDKVMDIKMDFIKELLIQYSNYIRYSANIKCCAMDISHHVSACKNGDYGPGRYRIKYLRERIAEFDLYCKKFDQFIGRIQDLTNSYVHFLVQFNLQSPIVNAFNNVNSLRYDVALCIKRGDINEENEHSVNFFLNNFNGNEVEDVCKRFEQASLAFGIIISSLISRFMLQVDKVTFSYIKGVFKNIWMADEVLSIIRTGECSGGIDIGRVVEKQRRN